MASDVVNDIIVSGLDQILPMENTQKAILENVDAVIQESVKEGDPDIAGNALKSLLGVSRIAGLALAKFLYVFKYQWKNFNRRDTFEEYMNDFVGRKPITIKRYLRIWEMLISGDIPREYVSKLQLHSVKTLIPMANLFAQKYDISSAEWMKLADAPDVATVNKIIREIKKVPPRKGSLQIEWDEEQSQLTMWKDGKPHYVYLQFDENDDIIKAGLERLFTGKVMER